MRENKKTIKLVTKTFYSSSNIAGCDTCSWSDDGGIAARKHARETGHKTWNERNIIKYYQRVN